MYVLGVILAISCFTTFGNSAKVHHIAKRFDWQSGNNGQVLWSEHCDFYGNDLYSVQGSGDQCGGSCLSNSQCTHFTWTEYNGGTCYLKQGQVSTDQATYYSDYSVCGVVVGGGGPTANNVPGTRWADSTDSGGCQMPSGNYAIQNAVALGQSGTLGSLAWRNGLCGQVLQINCGGSPVQAVVASTCNLGSTTCGVDMITKTWNIATGNQPPGVATCSVQLMSTNPLNDGAPVCYTRPYSGPSAYYTSLGVFNTGGRVVKSAQAAGVNGQFQAGSGYLDFNANGQPLFNADATVNFQFEDGSSASFRYGDCKDGGNVYIWS